MILLRKLDSGGYVLPDIYSRALPSEGDPCNAEPPPATADGDDASPPVRSQSSQPSRLQQARYWSPSRRPSSSFRRPLPLPAQTDRKLAPPSPHKEAVPPREIKSPPRRPKLRRLQSLAKPRTPDCKHRRKAAIPRPFRAMSPPCQPSHLHNQTASSTAQRQRRRHRRLKRRHLIRAPQQRQPATTPRPGDRKRSLPRSAQKPQRS